MAVVGSGARGCSPGAHLVWLRPASGCVNTWLPQPSAALFEACCGDHIQPFDDDEDDDILEDKETQCAARGLGRARCVPARPPQPPRGTQAPPCLVVMSP